MLSKENVRQLAYGLEIKWIPRAGPVLFFSWKNKRWGLAFFCHRQEDRCLKLFGHTSFLCARCFGICIGASLALLLLLAHMAIPMIPAGILCLPLLVDGFSQLFGLRESNNAVRFFTGVVFSVGLILTLFHW